MVRIRPAEAADAEAIAQVRAQSWRAAYVGVIPDETLADLTAPDAVHREGQWRARHSMDGFLIAETTPPDAPQVIGFATFGPERGEDDRPGQDLAGPPEQDRAELYAVYVLPGHWSAGTGQALVDRAFALIAAAGYADISLWVIEGNARGRRFYEKAGFADTGESAVLRRLGGVTALRYRRLVS
jgi:ribosomal protein S18 acetylase RimI-like enzyme